MLVRGNMKQWGLFLLSIGCFQVMMSGLVSNPLGMMISGFTLMVIGGIMIWRKKRN